jgi:hypothetical protein
MTEPLGPTLRKRRDFGATLSDTFSFIRAHARTLALLYALFVVPFLLVATLLGADAFPALYAALSAGFDGLLPRVTPLLPGLLFSGLAYITASTLYPTLVYLCMRRADEAPATAPTVRDCTRGLVPKTLLNLAYVVTLVLALAVGAIVAIIPVIGILAYLPAVIWLVVCFTILTPVAILEDLPFPAAFRRAIRLVAGRWWYTVGVVAVIGLVCYGLSMAVSFAVNTVTGMASINFVDPEKDLARFFDRDRILVAGLSFTLQQVFYLVLHVGMGMHYYSLAEEKDARGLEARLDQLGSGRPGPSAAHPEEQY